MMEFPKLHNFDANVVAKSDRDWERSSSLWRQSASTNKNMHPYLHGFTWELPRLQKAHRTRYSRGQFTIIKWTCCPIFDGYVLIIKPNKRGALSLFYESLNTIVKKNSNADNINKVIHQSQNASLYFVRYFQIILNCI